MSVAPARRIALKVLGRVRRDEAFSGPVLAAELAAASLSPDDAALATRLTYGVLASVGVLDEALGRYAKGPLEPRVRDALRLAAYELLFGHAPGYAVVDQAVESVRAVRPQAAGLANAVMRRLAESAPSFPWGDPATDRDALARLSAHPRWIVDLVLNDLGEEAGRQMLGCGTEPAPTYVRLDPFAADTGATLVALASSEPVPAPPDADCYRLGRPSAAYRSAASGGWFAMDAAAQMAPRACAPVAGARVLDLGAGRGNKTICLQAIARRSGGPAHVTTVDVHAGKVDALRRRLDTSGVPDVDTTRGDALAVFELFGADAFDTVLLDAPCTGLGTLRRYPEKRWRLDPGAPERMAEIQIPMLRAAAAVVRPGGRVVYSTCSVARAENEAVIEGFLAGAPGFARESLRDVVPDEWAGFVTDAGMFQSWPTSEGPDGHFVAALRRER